MDSTDEGGVTIRCTVSDLLNGKCLDTQIKRGRMVFRAYHHSPHERAMKCPLPPNCKQVLVGAYLFPDGPALDCMVVDCEQPG